MNKIVPDHSYYMVRHTIEINKYLTNLVFSVRTVSYGSSFLRLLGHKSKGKNSVRNLRYGPQTRLVRGKLTILGIYLMVGEVVNFLAKPEKPQ